MTGRRSRAPVPIRYGSDLVVRMLEDLGIRYAAFNPGASFRGIHDSLVNRPGAPEIILATHEKIAANIAHGYAKATGDPMAVILHDVVGLLHGSLGLFYAHTDRVPMLALGGSGPQDASRRRPEIDWRHTANVQGTAVRDFTKWDDQPASVAAIPEAILRGHRITIAEPAGPVYLAIDADLQEAPADEGQVVDLGRFATPSGIAAEPAALERLAVLLCGAERPVVVAGFAGRDAEAFRLLPELAELVGAGVVDTGVRLNAPNRHPLNVTETDALREADLVLLLDVKDAGRTLAETDPATRAARSRLRDGARLVELGFNDRHVSAWVHHHGQLQPTELAVTADTRSALPVLLEGCRRVIAGEEPERGAARQRWRRRLTDLHDARWDAWAADARDARGRSPVATAELAGSVWAAIRDHDWVLTAGTASDWALRLWDFDRPYRWPGESLGTATQIGISLGVALAHRGTGRLVVDLQPDGDLLYDPGALWTAAAHRIPLLVVMFDNRAYYNDWNHQHTMARVRGTDRSLTRVGIALDEPPTDFALMARSFGWHAEGPIDDPGAIEGAVRRAAAVVTEEARPALVDVICEYR